MELLYKYKNAFNLRDEIGTGPHIDVQIDMVNKSPFFIRPYHVKEEDKQILDKEMNRLVILVFLKKALYSVQAK